MKIILKTADFSANNIGQVEVPIDFAVETLAYFEAIPTAFASLTYNQKFQINKFILGLKSNSLFAKNDHRVYLPIFGKTEGAVNMLNPAQTALNLPNASGSVIYDVNGLTLDSTNFTSNYNVKWDDSFFGFINKTNDVASVTRTSFIDRGAFVGIGRKLSSTSAGLVYSGDVRVLIPGRSTSNGYVFGSYGSAGVALSKRGSNVIVDGEYGYDADSALTFTDAPILFGGSGTYPDCAHSVALIVTGNEALTPGETQAYGALLGNLYPVL
jgi:hypothetical protein